jgi:hypothetical protein
MLPPFTTSDDRHSLNDHRNSIDSSNRDCSVSSDVRRAINCALDLIAVTDSTITWCQDLAVNYSRSLVTQCLPRMTIEDGLRAAATLRQPFFMAPLSLGRCRQRIV